ncbi:DUF1772 domain-containing protein [Mumia flava]|nr:anthrone oxygenase family protein [Mumia flava]
MTTVLGTTAVAATVTTGLVAGLLVVFAHAVMPGLGTLGDRAYLTAFQRIDAAIGNPWMMLAFLGSPVLVVAALAVDLGGDRVASPWLVAALVLIVVTIAITVVVHLPINALAQEAAPAFADASDLRARFETRWVPWNTVRAVTSTASLTALCGALLAIGRAAG